LRPFRAPVLDESSVRRPPLRVKPSHMGKILKPLSPIFPVDDTGIAPYSTAFYLPWFPIFGEISLLSINNSHDTTLIYRLELMAGREESQHAPCMPETPGCVPSGVSHT